MKDLKVRVISAALAILLFLGVFYFFQIKGLAFLCIILVVIMTLEGFELLYYKEEAVLFEKVLFLFMNLIVFGVTLYTSSEVGFAVGGLILCVSSLLKHKKFSDLSRLVEYQTKSLLGLFYLGLLPGLTVKLLLIPNGLEWFVFLLAVVFAGDSCAFLVGSRIGKNKLMPEVSPKKSVEGSIGGMIGSILAVVVVSQWYLKEVPFQFLMLLAILMGLFAQVGDLFESLLKRVAQIKDSGKIMPGHGGILDRIDGVLFATPILHLGIILLEKWTA